MLLNRTFLLPALAVVAAAATHADPSAAASLPAGSTSILSGEASLLAALPTPVSSSEATNRSISRDGRFVAFSSDADGLLDRDDDGVTNVYVKDTSTGAVTQLNRATGANGQ